MIKFMLFIDGTWLYSNTSRLVEASGEPGFVLDFGKLPRVLAEEVGRLLGLAPQVGPGVVARGLLTRRIDIPTFTVGNGRRASYLGHYRKGSR